MSRRLAGSGSGTLALVVVVVIAIGVAAIAPDARGVPVPAPSSATLGDFAGYAAPGIVSTMTASWKVPPISGDVEGSLDATWIGADTHARNPVPFVQIGTNGEDVGHHILYQAFWSDTARNYEIQVLPGTVHADDLVTATMTSAPFGWRLSLADDTAGWTARQVVTDEPAGPYRDAEYFEEDPTIASVFAGPSPFPIIPTVKMFELGLNGAPPHLTESDAAWMSLPGGHAFAAHLAAGPSIVVTRLHLSGPELQYLGDVQPANDQQGVIDEDRNHWSAATPQAQVRSELVGLEGALVQFQGDLLEQRWPGRAARHVELLARQLGLEDDLLVGGIDDGTGSLVAWRSRLVAAESRSSTAADRVRADLGLPPA